MALPKQRIPIQFTGLNNKNNSQTAPAGSFVQAQNILYDKIGLIDRRLAYKNLAINTENAKYLSQLNGQQLKYFLKIGRYKDKTLVLKANNLYGGSTLFDQQKEMEADNITTSIRQTKLASKVSFNASSQASCYSETYQNLSYSRNFDLSCMVSIESIKRELNFKIIRNDDTLYDGSTVAPDTGSTGLLYNNELYHTKVMSFENTSTSSTSGIVYNNITFLIFIHNKFVTTGTTNLTILKLSGYCVQGAEKSANEFHWSLGLVKRASIDGISPYQGAMVTEQFTLTDGCFASTAQIVLSGTTYYGYLETFRINTVVDDSIPNSFFQTTSYTLKSQLGLPTGVTLDKDVSLMAIKNISIVGDAFYTLSFACSAAGQSAGFTNDIIKLIKFTVNLTSLVPTIVSYQPSAFIFTDVNENTVHFNPLIVNMSFNDYSLDSTSGKNYNGNLMLYVTTAVGHHRTFADAIQRTEYPGNSVHNRVRAFTCIPGVLVSELDSLQNHTLASEIISVNENDYFLTAFNDVYQASYFLCAYNRIFNKFKVVSQFFYQNSGLVHNIDISSGLINLISNQYVDSSGNAVGYCYGLYNRNINYGWLPNLILKDQNLPLSSLTGKNLIMAVSYRNNFYKPAQSLALAVNQLSSGSVPINSYGQSYYCQATYDGYIAACSSRLVTIDIHFSKSKELNFNNNKYITGGYLSTYDGNNLNRHGFSIYPTILSSSSKFSNYNDPIGVQPVSYASYNGFPAVSAVGNIIRLNLTPLSDGTFPIKPGDTFRFVAYSGSGGGLALPESMTADSSFYFIDGGTNQLSSTELVVAQVVPFYTSGTLDYVEVIVADINNTGYAGVFANANILLAPYGIVNRKQDIQFVAVYRYYDNNNNLVYSAPSLPWGFSYTISDSITQKTNGLAHIGVVVSNYVQPNQPYKVVIELYRTIANSLAPVFYLCGSYDYAVNLKPDFITITTDVDDFKLISKQQLYTNGGELENIPVSNPYTLTTKDNRIYCVQGEDKNSIWYSKRLIIGEEVSFNDALTKNIVTKGGDILAIQAMDEKIIIFKEDSIYYFSGDGASATGQNESFSDVQILYNNIGLDKNQPHCVLLIDQGIVFKSSKGLYVIPRGLGEIQYIGAGIEDQVRNGILFTRIIGNNKRNEIKIGITSASNSSLYTFNFEQNLWYSDNMNQVVLDLESDANGSYALFNVNYFTNGGVTYGVNNPVKQEEIGGLKDFDDFTAGLNITSFIPVIPSAVQYRYQETLQTNWISLTGIQNFSRLWRLFLLGTNISGDLHIKMSIEYDWVTDGSNKEVHEFTLANSANSPLQIEFHLARQKCQAIRINIETVTGSANNFNITNVVAEVGMKNKLPLPTSQQK